MEGYSFSGPHPDLDGAVVTPRQGLAFVKRHGVVLQAARGPVPTLAEAIVGGRISGSWWGHAKGREIFAVSSVVEACPQVLVCKLVDEKVTYVHRRLWPALVKLQSRFRKARLAKEWHEHTAGGAHRSRRVPFPRWVPEDVKVEAANLSAAGAERILSPWLFLAERGLTRRSRT